MAEGDKNRQGLAYLLSLEKMPKRPALKSREIVNEIERWIRDLENYLRRLFGLFTADNINITIIEAGGNLRFVERLIQVNSHADQTIMLLDEDLRGRQLQLWVNWPLGPPTLDLDWFNWVSFAVHKYGVNYNPATDPALVSASTDGSNFVEVLLDKDTGKIKLHVDSTTGTVPDQIQIAILIGSKPAQPDVFI